MAYCLHIADDIRMNLYVLKLQIQIKISIKEKLIVGEFGDEQQTYNGKRNNAIQLKIQSIQVNFLLKPKKRYGKYYERKYKTK